MMATAAMNKAAFSRAIADKAGSDERTLTVSIAAVGFSVVVASVFIWAL
jgi:hypothetical protein